MLSNSSRLGKPPDHAQRDLKVLLGIGRRPAQLARGNFDVLLLQRGDHIRRRQLARGQLGGIEPDAHGILALAEDDHVAHARNALERIFHVDVDIVRDVLVRKAVIGRVESRGENEVRIRLGDGDAGVLDFLRQAALARSLRGSARRRRRCSGRMPVRKVTLMLLVPSLELVEVM